MEGMESKYGKMKYIKGSLKMENTMELVIMNKEEVYTKEIL